jgi:hypothetical protein
MKNRNIPFTTILVVLACFALPPTGQAVLPAPDGGYSGGNTAEGDNALLLLPFNGGLYNTAVGQNALYSDRMGGNNTAVGARALYNNSSGSGHTAVGSNALASNTASGYLEANTAVGIYALFNNTTGNGNVGIGAFTLVGNNTGSFNTALGQGAGLQTTGDNNIDIGFGVYGVAGESNTIRIGNSNVTATYINGIFGESTFRGATVYMDSSGKLGTMSSSKRFKQDIKSMDEASEALFSLKPVTFRYKKQIDPAGVRQFGLVAEDVEKINPDLVVRDKQGKPYSVRYEQVNAMLLNEFLKEHGKVEKLEAAVVQQRKDFQSTGAQQRKDFETTTAQQQKEIQALAASLTEQAAQIQKVSAQFEVGKTRPQVVLNNP